MQYYILTLVVKRAQKSVKMSTEKMDHSISRGSNSNINDTDSRNMICRPAKNKNIIV